MAEYQWVIFCLLLIIRSSFSTCSVLDKQRKLNNIRAVFFSFTVPTISFNSFSSLASLNCLRDGLMKYSLLTGGLRSFLFSNGRFMSANIHKKPETITEGTEKVSLISNPKN